MTSLLIRPLCSWPKKSCLIITLCLVQVFIISPIRDIDRINVCLWPDWLYRHVGFEALKKWTQNSTHNETVDIFQSVFRGLCFNHKALYLRFFISVTDNICGSFVLTPQTDSCFWYCYYWMFTYFSVLKRKYVNAIHLESSASQQRCLLQRWSLKPDRPIDAYVPFPKSLLTQSW